MENYDQNMKNISKPSVIAGMLMLATAVISACSSEPGRGTAEPGNSSGGSEPPHAPTKIIERETPESSILATTDTAVPDSADGIFTVGNGSEATFTVNEKLSSLPLPNNAVMRTGDITGEIDLSSATASLVIDLHTLKSDASRRDRYIRDRLFPSQPEQPSRSTSSLTSLNDSPMANHLHLLSSQR
jgi:hypothetical protein